MKRLFFTFLICLISLSVLAQDACNNQATCHYNGYDYELIEVNGRCWFKENLRYLPSVSPLSQYGCNENRIHVYNYDGIFEEEAIITEEYLTHGALYQDSDNKCPSGWSIPSVEHVSEIIDEWGGNAVAGQYLKSEVMGGEDLLGLTPLASGSFYFLTIGNTGCGDDYGSYFSGLNTYSIISVGYNYALVLSTSNNSAEILSLSGNGDDNDLTVPVINTCCPSVFGYASASIRCVLDENVQGCINPNACNYNPFATVNGPCIYYDLCGECGGDNTTCMDECGVPNGPGPIYECGCDEILQGECDCEGTIPEQGYDCDGNCLNDFDGDGICNEFEVYGCTDFNACNFFVEATEDDGTCTYSGDICNDNDYLTEGDFIQNDCSCNGYGCNNPNACNFSPTAINQNDLCEFESCIGCTDVSACNYDSFVTVDNGTCFYIGDECNDEDITTFNDIIQSNCECQGQFIGGCTYMAACNFNQNAIIDDGSCLFIGDPCDDLNPLTFNDIIDENCFCGEMEITRYNELENSLVNIYPNPASNNLTVDLGHLNGVNTTIKLYGSSSELVFEKQSTSSLLIDVSSFSKGLYTLEISTPDKVLKSQLIIQ